MDHELKGMKMKNLILALTCLVACLAATTYGQEVLTVQTLDTGGWTAATRTTAQIPATRPGIHRCPQTRLWEHSPAAPHHQAAVKVRSGTAAGSGVAVDLGGFQGVLTAAHIFEGTGQGARVTFQDGTTRHGTHTVDATGLDLAWVFVQIPPSIPTVRLASRTSSRVEFVTFGGPLNRLRHFWGRTVRDGDFQAVVVSGDSGGAILDTQGRLVGIQATGGPTVATTTDHHGEVWDLYGEAHSAPLTGLRRFVQRVRQRWCPDGSCQVAQGPIPATRPGRPQVQPVDPGELYPDQDPVQSPRPSRPSVTVDYERLAQIIVERYQDQLQGPQGPAGPRGPSGQDAQVNIQDLAAQVQSQLPPIQVDFLGDGRQVVDRQEVRLGQTLNVPPVRLEVHHQDGRWFYQEQALGQAVTLGLVESELIEVGSN